jgi:hypothetical protein
LSFTVTSVRTRCLKREDRTRPLGFAICRSTARTTKLSAQRATGRARRLRVHTRVTTVTRLEAKDSHPIVGPSGRTSFGSSNRRPRLELRLRSLNRNNGVDRCFERGLSFEPYPATLAQDDPSVHDWTAKTFAAYVVAFSRLTLPGMARRSRRTFAKTTANVAETFFFMRSKGAQGITGNLWSTCASYHPRGKDYGSSCSVVLNKKRLLNSVTSPAFFPATGCNRADKGLFHFHASDATSPKMRAS